MIGASGDEEEEEEMTVPALEMTDEDLRVNTLNALNMMRKNRHFCDVILHVCALAVQHYYTFYTFHNRTNTS